MNISEQVIAPAVAEYNQTFGDSARIQEAKDAILSGQGGTLDSLELVNFVVMVERNIRTVTGKDIRLVTEQALALNPSPFLNLRNLEKLIADKVGVGA